MRIIAAFFLMCALGGPASVRAASLIHDTQVERTITALVSPLAAAANIAPGRLRVHIVHDDDFNAFVMGGEDVYIYTGLLTQIKSPAALQAVVAHELGHTLGGHMAQMSARMNAEMKRALLIQTLGVGLMVAGGNPSLGAGVLAGAGGVATQSMLAFSRDEERIADNLGVDLMVRAAQDPDGFIQVFEQMRDITGAMEARVNPARINHPLTDERLRNVRARIKAQEPVRRPSSATAARRGAEYDLVRAKLIGYLDGGDRVRALYPATDTSAPAMYARAIADMTAGDYDAARTTVRRLISGAPENPYYYEVLGDIEYRAGNYDAAVAAYEQSLTYAPSAPQIQTALALVLTARSKPDDMSRAADLCRRALLAEPAPLTYWVLARAYSDGRADWAMAEYYAMIGNTQDARRAARRAQKKLDKDAPEYVKAGDILRAAD